MTVTRRIRRRGEHEISRKTIACGNAGCSGGPVVTTLVCVTTLCARGCGCSGHPAFPTPSVGRKAHAQLGRIAPRECGVIPNQYERATLSVVVARDGGRSSIPEQAL